MRVRVLVVVISHNIHEIEQRVRFRSDLTSHPLSRSGGHFHIPLVAESAELRTPVPIVVPYLITRAELDIEVDTVEVIALAVVHYV